MCLFFLSVNFCFVGTVFLGREMDGERLNNGAPKRAAFSGSDRKSVV